MKSHINNKTIVVTFLLILFNIQFLGFNTIFNNSITGETEDFRKRMSDINIGEYFVPGYDGSLTIDEVIKIGILGDLDHVSGNHTWKGALLAAREINEAGGITINSTQYFVGLVAEDTEEADFDLNVSKGIAAAQRMITDHDPYYVIGGYNNRSTLAYLETLMDNDIIFMSTGTASDELTERVRTDYDRYKYTFRVSPINRTRIGADFIRSLVNSILYINSTFQNHDVNDIGILYEDLPWTDDLLPIVEAYISLMTGGWASVVESRSCSINPTNSEMDDHLNAFSSFGCDIVVPLMTQWNCSTTMVEQYASLEPNFLLAGLDHAASFESHWTFTGGASEYEIILYSNAKTNKTEKTIPFWDDFTAEYGHSPDYMAIGSYDAVYMLANAAETTTTFDSDATVSQLEGFDRNNSFIGASGNIAFWPLSHELVAGWPFGVGLKAQWQASGNLVVIPSAGPGGVLYPISLATGPLMYPPWVLEAWNGTRSAPGSFILDSDAGVPDTDGNFNLIWTDSSGAQNYSIYEDDQFISSIHGGLILLAEQNATSPHPISGHSNGTYYYIVVAHNDYGETLSNCFIVVITSNSEEDVPGPFVLYSNDAGDPDTDGDFNLVWTDSSGAQNYSIYEDDQLISSIHGGLTLLANQNGTSPHSLSGYSSGSYYFIVVAHNEYGET
ncbi:MAG: ABC transporter substrate-binding protein, partial [Promethearchaeota archaeon]